MPDIQLSDTLRIRDKGDGNFSMDEYSGAAWNEIVKVAKATGNIEVVGLFSDGLSGKDINTVADDDVVGGLLVIHPIAITAGALGDTDVTLTYKTRVIDAWLVLRGAGVATTTLQVKNGATAITNAMAASGADKAVVRATTFDDAQWEIAAGGTLRVTSATGATQPDATVYVLGMRIP